MRKYYGLRLVRCFIFCAVILTGIVQAKDNYGDAKYITRVYLSTAVHIRHSDSSGTGVIARSQDLYILFTNYHVVKHAKAIEVETPIVKDKDIIKSYKFWLTLIDSLGRPQFERPADSVDLVAIAFDARIILRKLDDTGMKVPSLPFSYFAEPESVCPGQPILFCGYPFKLKVNGYLPLVRGGIVAGIDLEKDEILLEASSFPGSSGSPVYLDVWSGYLRDFKGHHGNKIFMGIIHDHYYVTKDVESKIPEDSLNGGLVETENIGLARVVPAWVIRELGEKAIAKYNEINR